MAPPWNMETAHATRGGDILRTQCSCLSLPQGISPQTLSMLTKGRISCPTYVCTHLGIGVRHRRSWCWDLGLRAPRAESGADGEPNLLLGLIGRRGARSTNPSHSLSSPTSTTATTTTCARRFHRARIHIATSTGACGRTQTTEASWFDFAGLVPTPCYVPRRLLLWVWSDMLFRRVFFYVM